MLVPLSAPLYIARDHADFRKQCDGLSGLVRNQFNRDPTDESLYVFFNRRRDQVKILYFQSGGYCLWWKRLERGRFSSVVMSAHEQYVSISSTELLMLIDGISLQQIKRRKRYIKQGK